MLANALAHRGARTSPRGSARGVGADPSPERTTWSPRCVQTRPMKRPRRGHEGTETLLGADESGLRMRQRARPVTPPLDARIVRSGRGPGGPSAKPREAERPLGDGGGGRAGRVWANVFMRHGDGVPDTPAVGFTVRVSARVHTDGA